mmetsp:Transcript_72604/g.228721  ORF Transcript_72604/g.228721 Transcript_72604/m.228721 type:complete len:236 (-) Transcript_72604:1041-1748(-)
MRPSRVPVARRSLGRKHALMTSPDLTPFPVKLRRLGLYPPFLLAVNQSFMWTMPKVTNLFQGLSRSLASSQAIPKTTFFPDDCPSTSSCTLTARDQSPALEMSSKICSVLLSSPVTQASRRPQPEKPTARMSLYPDVSVGSSLGKSSRHIIEGGGGSTGALDELGLFTDTAAGSLEGSHTHTYGQLPVSPSPATWPVAMSLRLGVIAMHEMSSSWPRKNCCSWRSRWYTTATPAV